jgi:hypothetical protein
MLKKEKLKKNIIINLSASGFSLRETNSMDIQSRELGTRYLLAHTDCTTKPKSSKKASITYIISIPRATTWSWAIFTTFYKANKRLTLPSNTTCILRTVDTDTSYTVTNQTTSAVVATGRVDVLKWVATSTSWYGRKRGTWWLKNIDANEELWKPTQSIVPTALVKLQAGLRSGKRKFVAMKNITMADPLVFAYTYEIFSTIEDVSIFDEIPQVVLWYQRMQETYFLNSSESLLLHSNTKCDITVPCLRATSVGYIVPCGCSQPAVLTWCNEASKRFLIESTQNGTNRKLGKSEVRKWYKGGGQSHTKGKSKRIKNALIQVKKKLENVKIFQKCVPCALNIDQVQNCCCFNTLPFSVDPASMMSGKDQRGRDASVKIEKKRNQVRSMLQIILNLIKDGDTAVEFAAGSGYIGLVLAALRPNINVILMDQNPVSMQYARSRAMKASLNNIKCVVGDIRDFHVEGGYQIGFALHACGSASDYALDHCIQNKANYVIAPCCAGFMQNTLNDDKNIIIPTSNVIRNAGVTRDEFISLTAGADHSSHPDQAESGRTAMAMLDLDRNLRAEENGYVTKYYRMVPENCTPKNQILVGTVDGVESNGAGGNGGDGDSNGDDRKIRGDFVIVNNQINCNYNNEVEREKEEEKEKETAVKTKEEEKEIQKGKERTENTDVANRKVDGKKTTKKISGCEVQ